MGRAQLGIEFVAVFAIALVLFIAMQVYQVSQNNLLNSQQTLLSAKKTANEAAALINAAARQNGFYAEFVVPSRLSWGEQYNLSINNYSVNIEWSAGTKSAIALVNAHSVTNSSGATFFYLAPGTGYVNNTGGAVVVGSK